MGTTVVKRPERRPAPEPPAGEVVLEAPPEIPAPTGQRVQQLMMLLPMLAGSGAMALMFAGSRGGLLSWVAGAAFGVSALGMIAAQMFNNPGQPGKQQMAVTRREYIRALALQRKRVHYTIERQREAMFYRHPSADSLWSTVESSRLWERRRADADFGVVRIGLGPQELATPLVPPQTKSLDTLETLCASALRKFIQKYAIVPDLPVAMALNGFASVYVRGDIDRARAMVRALLAQVVAFHAPDDMLVTVCAGPQERHHWEWTKWLPHALHPLRHDALGQLRLVAPTVTALEAMLEDLIANRPRFNPAAPGPQIGGPHVLVVLDGGDVAGSDHLMTDGGVEGVTVIDLTHRPPRALDRAALVLEITDPADNPQPWGTPAPAMPGAPQPGMPQPGAANGSATGTGTAGPAGAGAAGAIQPAAVVPTGPQLRSHTIDGEADIGIPDSLTITEADGLARQLSPLRLSIASRGEQPLSADMDLGDLLELGDPFEFDPARTWVPRPNRDRLRVPIGLSPEGAPVELDLKESAQDGMGPHGLLIGATGSGKSELLRTLVMALAATHDSETLNFVLVDFKGGATFTKLDRLPHTSAVITNLADELPLVDRMTDAINGELLRRQELLRAAGNYSSLRDYEKARAAGAPLSPLPSLMIICDEFSELLSAKPDFIDMFVQIGRLGRSLGVHLLLASQRLEEGRLRGLDTHLSYRIGLRTFSTTESRIVLGSADAYELPRAPGHGFLKSGTEQMTRFRAAYVSGIYQRGAGPRVSDDDDGWSGILDYSTQYVAARRDEEEAAQPDPDAEESEDALGETFLDILVDRIEGKGTAAHQVWLPPLKEPATLDHLLPGITEAGDAGLVATDSKFRGTLTAVVGIVDRPLEQRRDLHTLDLSGAAGHVAVVGGPQSGKSTAIRTLITSLALTHTPRQAQFYCLDFGGGSLAGLRDLPHVGGVAGRLDVNQVRRTVAELQNLLLYREQVFTTNGIESMPDYRRAKRDGQYADDPYGDAFLVVDGWPTIRNDFDDLEPSITDLAIRGLSYGIHVIIAAGRWMDFRSQLRDMVGTKLELRLGDPSDSAISRRGAINVPDQIPGRGLTAEQFHMLTALPRIDGDQDAESLTAGVAALVKRAKAAWPGAGAPAVRLLPRELPYEQLPKASTTRDYGVPIGIAESDLQPVHLDFRTEPHLLMFGDSESGKTGFLRSLATSITEGYSPEEARIMLVDFRRTLLGAIESDHLIGYGTSAAMTESMMTDTAEVMERRLPGPDITPEQLRNRSWWTGPDLYLLVDDYDLVATGHKNPLAPMVDYLAQGRDIGLHLIVTRRSGGAGRALYDPVIQRLKDLSSPGIMLSGSRDEGVLIGNVRPSAQPPGRGWLVTRKRGTELVQLGWLPPKE